MIHRKFGRSAPALPPQGISQFAKAIAKAGITGEPTGYELPEAALYGRLGQYARDVNLPISASYPALIGVFSIIPDVDVMCGVRTNQYVAILGQSGFGKNVSLDRAFDILEVTCMAPIGAMAMEHTPFAKAAPTGSRQLMQLIGDKAPNGKGAKSAPRVAGPKKFLLRSNEIDQCFTSAKTESSTLIARFADFWDENQFTLPDGRTGSSFTSADCRFSWIGGLPTDTDNPEKFLSTFGSATGDGLYNRFIFGYVPHEIDFDGKNAWKPKDLTLEELTGDFAALAPQKKWAIVQRFDDDAWDYLQNWSKATTAKLPRMLLHIKKIAVLTASANLDQTVTLTCIKAAIVFMEWQARLRKVFSSGVAENIEGQFTERALAKFEALAREGKPFNVMRLAHDLKWTRKWGTRIVNSTIKALIDESVLVPHYKNGDEVPNAYWLNPILYPGDEYALNTANRTKNRDEHDAIVQAKIIAETPKEKAKRLKAKVPV